MLIIQGVAPHLPAHLEEVLQVDLWVEMSDTFRCISMKPASFCRMKYFCLRPSWTDPVDPNPSQFLSPADSLSECQHQVTPKHLPDPSFMGRTDAAFRDSRERRFWQIRFLTPEPESVFTTFIPHSGTEGPICHGDAVSYTPQQNFTASRWFLIGSQLLH